MTITAAKSCIHEGEPPSKTLD